MGLSPAMNFLRGSIPLPPALRLFRVRLTGDIVVEFQASSGRKSPSHGAAEPGTTNELVLLMMSMSCFMVLAARAHIDSYIWGSLNLDRRQYEVQ